MKHDTNFTLVMLGVLALVPRGEVRAVPPDFISSDLSASLYYFFRVKAKKMPALVNTAATAHELAVGHGCMGHLVLAQGNQVGTVPEDWRDR